MNQPIIIQQPEPRLRRDPILSEPRYRMRVTVNTHSTSVYQADVQHHMLFRGTHEIVAYESQVPLIMAKVETRGDIVEQARETWKRKRRAAMEEIDPKVMGWRDIDPADYDKHPDLRRLCRQTTFAAHAITVEGEFQNVTGRGILPLSSAERIGEPLPALRPEQETAIANIVEQLGKSFGAQLAAKGGTGGGGFSPEQFQQLLAAQQASAEAIGRSIAAALSRPADPPKNGRDGK